MSATVFGQARSLEGQPFELSSDLVNALHLRGLLAGCGVSLLIRGLMIDDYLLRLDRKLFILVVDPLSHCCRDNVFVNCLLFFLGLCRSGSRSLESQAEG